MRLYFILISILINSIAHVHSYKLVEKLNRERNRFKNIYLNDYLNDVANEENYLVPHNLFLSSSSSSSSPDSLSRLVDQVAKNLNDYEYVESLPNKASLDTSGDDLDNLRVGGETGGADEEELEMHSSLVGGHQYVSGGAGEGKQHLQPDGAIDNKEEIKSDEDLPAYCDPPNPCPIGVTSDDCDPRPFQEFSAEYSKAYQEQQNCMCDDDHNECHKSSKIKSQDKIVRFLNNLNDKLTQVVAKKSPRVRRDVNQKDHNETRKKRNPYLSGEAIKIHVAKKSSLL